MKIRKAIPNELWRLWFNEGITDPPDPIKWECCDCKTVHIAPHDVDRNKLKHAKPCMVNKSISRYKPPKGVIQGRLHFMAIASRRKK